MNCRLIKNIKHSCEYNPGGIKEIYLLDIRDFKTYLFRNDELYENCFVDRIFKEDTEYINLDIVSESTFNETHENGIYKQQLTTFVGTLSHEKTADLLLAKANKYLIAFRTNQDNIYTFGSDGGASVNFTQSSGQTGETSGYSITITKDSVFPLFEVDANKFNKLLVLGTENNIIVSTEDYKYAILI